MTVYLSTQNSPIQNLRVLAQGATSTKELNDAIESHNSKSYNASFRFYLGSTLVLPILGIAMRYTANPQAAIITVPLTFFTFLQTEFYYNKEKDSLSTVELHRTTAENILNGIKTYIDAKRVAKEAIVIARFNVETTYCGQYDHNKDQIMTRAKERAQRISEIYDNTRPTEASQVLAWQEYKEAVVLATIAAKLKVTAISGHCWRLLLASCHFLIDGKPGVTSFGGVTFLDGPKTYVRIAHDTQRERIVAEHP